VANTNTNDGLDIFFWQLHKNEVFSVKSMYNFLVNNGVKVSAGNLTYEGVTKIKTFLWYLKKEVILTKDTLAKRRWNGSRF